VNLSDPSVVPVAGPRTDRERVRVLYVIDSLRGGGAENSLADVVTPLASRGVDTTVVALLPSHHDVEARLREVVKVIDVSGLSRLGKVAAIDRLMRQHSFDLVHTTLFHADTIGRVLGGVHRRSIVTTLANEAYTAEHRRNSSFGPWAVRGAHALDAATAQLATRFHSVSEAVAATMSERLRVPRSRIDVVPRGRPRARLGRRTADRRLQVRSDLGIAQGAPVVLCVARLDKQKGVDVVIAAHERLRLAVPDALLLVAGGAGNDEARIMRAAGTIYPGGIRFLGHRGDVPDLMCAADALCIGSRWEGLGGAAIEAMALELPIVMAGLPALLEVTGDAAVGVVDGEDPTKYAVGLERALAGGPEVARKVAFGSRRFQERFTIEAAADGMRAFYDRALASRRSAGTSVK
jgi:glycosyltransferase involved in cell wall biosynthesis